MTTSYTVAQALATNASGILVVDTAINIATNLSNPNLVGRVSLFSMNGNGSVSAWEAAALAAIGTKFSLAGFKLTERDTVAQLTAPAYAAGPTISGIVVAVSDTAANILAAAGNPIIHNAVSITLSANATLTLSQLLTLEAYASFTAPALTLTLADTAANLLAFTPAEAKASLTVFQVAVNSVVTAAQALTLGGMSHFGIGSGVTLTISDSIANIVASTSSLHSVLVSSGTAVNFTDTMANLLAQAGTFQWSQYPSASVTLSVSSTATVTQALMLEALPNFAVAAGQTLTIADTVNQLVTLTAPQAAIAAAITLSGNDTATAAQLVALAALPHFSPGHTLTVDDTLAHLATLTTPQSAFATAETIDDTVSNLLAAQPAALSGATAIVAELDGAALNAGQAIELAALAAHAALTLHPNGSNTTLTISDTAQNLSAASASITTLQGDGPVAVVPTGTSNGSILSASSAVALLQSSVNPADGTYAVADTGSALSAVASQIFGQGFEAITVTSGTFAGTMAQLLDPTLHFTSGSAQLNASAVSSATQALELAALPSFSLASSVTLTVLDSVANILAAAATLPTIATSILANDTETVSAAAAATLAALTGFSLHGNFLILNDTAANLETATPAAIALASTVNLTSDARISEATALQFLDMGLKFSPNGFFVTIADTATNLEALAASPSALTVVNGWNGEAVLSADATVSVANANLLSQLSGFNVGTHHLTISDSASNLLGASGGALALAYAVQISQASTVTAANAATLEALHNFSANGLLTITDTPANLAVMASFLATPASAVSLAVETDGNASGYAINATQFAAMLALPHFSLTGFAGTVAVTDTATSLAALEPSLTGLTSPVLSHITTTLSAAATVTVATAEALHALPDFSRGGFDLTISDTAINIATLDQGTAALATSIVTLGGSSSLSVAAFDSLVGSEGFSGTPDSLTVSDTATNLLTLVGSGNLTYIASTILSASATLSVANAELLSTLPNLLIGNDLAIADTAANLLHITGAGSIPDDWAVELQASSVTLTANALSISAAQAALLAQLGSRFSNGGFTLTVQDTPTALLGLTNGLGSISGQISSIALASGTWTITLAQGEQLASLPHFTVGSATGVIADTVANLSASANAILIAAIIAAVPSITFTLAGNDTASVAQAEALHALGNAFSRGSSTLTIIDGAGHLATLDSPTAALASAIELQGSTLTSVANFEAIRALPNYSNNGNLLVVSDTAAHLLGLVSSDVSLAAEIMLSTTATNLTGAQAEQLATLSDFTTGIAHYTILDSAADLLQITGEGSQPDDWAGELAARTVTLTGNATVTAAQAAELALLGSRFSVGANTLTVSDSAANLVSAANAGGLALAGAITLSGDETALSAANATQLAALSHFNKGGHQITVSDTAANLAFAGNAAGLALTDHVQLSQATSMTVVAAEALIGMADFQVNGAAPITIDDTLPDLLGLAGADLPNNNSVLAATSIELSANAVATVAQMEALAALPQYSTFSLNGFTITVEDSGRHLATFTADTVAVPTAYVMVGDATLSAAQAGVLAADNAQIGDNNLTVADTPTALLSLSNAVNALATGLELSGNATATAAQATQLETLAADQRFSTGGHALTVTDSASALLGLSAPTQQLATTLQLSESGDTVNVAGLLQLTELGSKFSVNSNTLTVADTATHLATLNSLETALVAAVVLNQTATIGATTATELAALPDFTLEDDVTLFVQGTYAELAALPNSITSIATLELTGSGQTLSAAQAAALAALSNFQPNSGVVVQDTIADLNSDSNAGWQTVATGGYIVTDSVSNLLDNASTMLLTDANSVTLLGDAQVDASQFATLAGMANFSRGTAALTVIDGPVEIANNATEIGLLASSALIDSSAPVTAAQAEALAHLNTAHMLSFTGGVTLAVQDSFANLTLLGNADGLALASTITVVGTGAELAAATAHDWGSAQPFYELNASGDITGAQAAALHGLGGHFLPESFTLTVADNAANVVSNGTAIQALGISAQVTDSVAGVDAAATALAALGSTVQSIALTDSGSVTAAAAAGLAPVAAQLSASAIAVSDTALAVDTYLTALETLGTHLSGVTVDDSAANVAAVASDLSGLGSTLHITLTDDTPVTVSADIASGLVPVAMQLGSTTINVSDTGAHIAADAAALAELVSTLGTVTLSDGTTTDAATAAAIAQIDQHLGTGVTLSVADSAAAIAAAAGSLGTLLSDGKLGSVTAANQTVSNVLEFGSALAGIHATATISDTAAAVSAHLDALELLSGSGGVVTGITLTDGGVPDITLSLAQLTTDADVLGLISGSFHYAISDTSANIAADLLLGGSKILTLGSAVDSIALTVGTTLTLTSTVLLRVGVADGAGTPLTKLASGDHVAVTGVGVADFTNIDALSVTPISFTVVDSGDDIATDLELGSASSELLAHRTSITSITPSSTITLDYATATALHVNDGAGSVLSKVSGAPLDVSGVPVAGIANLLTTGVFPAVITVSDSAANIAADLETSSPVLVQYANDISAITITPSGTVTLDADHVLAVNTNAVSLLLELGGANLAVTGATVAQLDSLNAMSAVPSSVAVSDTASDIATDLQLGADSRLQTYAANGMVTAVAVTGGPVILAESYLMAVGYALPLLPSDSLQVTGVPISDIAYVAGLGALTSMAVNDMAANIEADLNLDASSELALHHSVIASVTVTGGSISLTDAQALAAETAALALLPSGSLDVTGVAVADIASIAAIAALSGMTVSDTGANIATDLALGASSSELELNVALITGITVASGTVILSDTHALAVTAALALLPPDSLTVIDVPMADIATIAALTALASMTVLDTAAAVHADLVGVTSVLETDVVAGTIIGIIVNDAPVALTDAQAEQVLAALGVLSGTGGLTISEVSIADVPTIGALSSLSGMTVSDTASNVQADLLNGASSVLEQSAGSITGISFSSGTSVSLTDTQAELVLAALANLPAGSLTVSDVSVADVPAIAALSGLTGMTVLDSAVNIHADLVLGESSALEQSANVITGIAFSVGNAVALTDAQAELVLFALAELPAGSLTVSGVSVADVPIIALQPALISMSVIDGAGTVNADLVSGTSTLVANHSKISSIALGGGDTLTMTVAQTDAASSALALIGSYQLAINDTALNVQNDLALGASSVIGAYNDHISGLIIPSNSTITLTESQATASFVAGILGDAGNLTRFVVTGVTVAQISTVLDLNVLFTTMTLSDSALNVQNDLALGAMSNILGNISSITGIVLPTASTITLTASEALYNGVNTALNEATNLSSFAVTGAAVAQVSALVALEIFHTAIAVSDSAANIQDDLQLGVESMLEANAMAISAIAFSSGTSVALTDTQADLVLAALAFLPAGSLTVSDVPLTDVAAFTALAALASMTVLDTAAAVGTDLASGSSVLEAGVVGGTITSITVNDAAVALTDTQAETVLTALGVLGGTGGLTVSGVSLAHITTIAALPALTGMTISDSAANIKADLILDASSLLALNHSVITGVTAADGPISLTDAQALAASSSALALLASNSLDVTGVTVSDVASIAAIAALSGMAVSDTAANVHSDLVLDGSSVLQTNHSKIDSISVTGGLVTLADSDARLVLGALALLDDSNSLVVTVVPVADVTAIGQLAALDHMTVSDSAGNLHSDLITGNSSVLERNAEFISTISFSSGSSITLTSSQAGSVLDALAELPGGSVTVTGVPVAQVSTLQEINSIGSVNVVDTAAAVKADLTAGRSTLEDNVPGIIGSITVNDAAVALTDTQAEQVLDALGVLGGSGGLTVSGVSVADITTITSLSALTGMTISDSAINIQNDLALGAGSEILGNAGFITAIIPPDLSTITLTEAQALYSGVAEALTLITNSDIIVEITNVAVNQIDTATGLNINNTELAISDTASAVQTDLALGASSKILAHIANVTSIALPSSSTITLTEAQAVFSGVATALIDATNLATFAVTGVTLAQVATVAALNVPHTSMAVSGAFSSVISDLKSGSSVLVPNVGSISAISVSGGPFIGNMTAAQILATGVGAALDLLTSQIAMHVDTDVSHVSAVLALGVSQTLFEVSDTSLNIQQDLASGSSGLVAVVAAGAFANLNSVTLTDSSPSITLTEAQATAANVGTVLQNISMDNSFTLNVTGVTIAQMPTVLGLEIFPTHMAIVDTEAAVQADLTLVSPTLVSNVSNISSITLTSGDTLTLTVAQIATDQAVLALIGTYHLAVSDTAANIESDLAAGTPTMLADLANISTITITDEGTQIVSLSVAELVADTGLLAKIASDFKIDISDTAAHVQGDLTGGSSQILVYAGSINEIVLTDGSEPTITLTVAQLTADTAALATIVSPFFIAVSDTAAHVQADLAAEASSSILGQSSKITGITLTPGNTITLTEAQLVFAGVDDGIASAVAQISGLSNLIATAATIAQIATLKALYLVPTEIRITDSITHIIGDLIGSGLIAAANTTTPGLITTVTPSDTSTNVSLATSIYNGLPSGVVFDESALTITDTAANLLTAHSNLPAILTNAMLVTLSTDATGVTAANATLLSTILGASLNSHTLEVADTSANLLNSSNSAGIALATTVELAAPETMDAATATLVAALNGFTRGPAITISDSIANLTNSSYVNGLDIATILTPTDTSTDVAHATAIHGLAVTAGATFDETGLTIADTASALLGALTAILTAAQSVELSVNATGLTAAQATTLADMSNFSLNGKTLGIVDTSSHLLLLANADGITEATTVQLSAPETMSAATATSVATLNGFTTGPAITISDTLANLANAGNTAGLGIATTVTPTDTVATVAQVTAILAALAIGATFTETSVTISDTAAHLLAAPPDILSGVSLVTLSNNAVGLTAAQATTLSGILGGSTNSHTVNVVDTAANLLASGNAAGIALATSVGVSDTAANMLALAPVLIAMEPLLTSATITDSGPLSASAVSDLLALPNLSAGSLTIADTGSQIAAAIEANGATGVTFLEAHSVQLSGNSIIGASDAAALEQLGGSLNKNSFTLSVSDTASHLTDTADGYLAAVSDTSLVNGVYLKTTGGTVTVTATVGAALIGIPNFHKNPVGGGTNILTVQDTAAHFDANYTTLLTDLALFDHLFLSSSASVTDTVYGELLGLGVQRANGGVTVTVRDTASNIAANATTQLGGSPSITPIAWQLSGAATVTEAQAAVLGGLGGFSSGPYALTLSATASGVSVSDANALGVLGSAFHLGGFHVNVTGSVAMLSALTTAALTVVTPQISDLFSNIAQMSPSSSLLGGTMTVTDSEAITVAQATSFFALVQVGSGSGIPAANITFNAGAETITDTLANIQTLTGLSSWTGNVPLHSDFHLEVADTVANLILPANTTALSGMFGTTLAGNQTVTAANLETLFNLESTIHFSLGSNQLTIQDTAADLLNPSYSDAIAMAQHLMLLGPDTVVTPDAETLMATGKLVLTSGTILTISDTSTDLLDGVLGGAITGGGFTSFVHVTLSDDETLDAQTAEALVSLPGYAAGSHTLSIVDGAPYLLNAANHSAEVDATSVTLDGDADVSAATAVSLVGLPNFALDGNTLFLASNDFADAATLATLAGIGSGFNLNGNTLTLTQNASLNATQLAGVGDFGSSLHLGGHTLTMTQDALALTPDEYAAVVADGVALNGHALSAMPTAVTVSEVSGNVEFDGTGVNGATVTLYGAGGSSLSTTTASPTFTISAAETGSGINTAVTETVGGTESAPIIALEQTILTNAATTDGATFATSGQVLVGTNESMNLVNGSAPSNPANPVLVYDPTAHTLSFDAAGHPAIVLLTLGTATHPASLDPSEIFVKHFATG